MIGKCKKIFNSELSLSDCDKFLNEDLGLKYLTTSSLARADIQTIYELFANSNEDSYDNFFSINRYFFTKIQKNI